MLDIEEAEAEQESDDHCAGDHSRVEVVLSRGPQEIGQAVYRDDRERDRALGVVDGTDRVQSHVRVQQSEAQAAEDAQAKQAGETIGHHARREKQQPKRPQEPDGQHEGVVAHVGAKSVPERVRQEVVGRGGGIVEPGGNEGIPGHRVRVGEHQQHRNEPTEHERRHRAGVARRLPHALDRGPGEERRREEEDLERAEEEPRPEGEPGEGPKQESSPLLREPVAGQRQRQHRARAQVGVGGHRERERHRRAEEDGHRRESPRCVPGADA